MENSRNDFKYSDPKTGNPTQACSVKDMIAGWKLNAVQASTNNTDDFEVFNFIRIIKNMRNISVFRYLHRLEPEICKNPKKTYEYYKCLNTYVATSRWRVVSLNKKKKTLHIRILCFKNGVAKYFWRSMITNIQNKELKYLKINTCLHYRKTPS